MNLILELNPVVPSTNVKTEGHLPRRAGMWERHTVTTGTVVYHAGQMEKLRPDQGTKRN